MGGVNLPRGRARRARARVRARARARVRARAKVRVHGWREPGLRRAFEPIGGPH
jgi:hypothetical protein